MWPAAGVQSPLRSASVACVVRRQAAGPLVSGCTMSSYRMSRTVRATGLIVEEGFALGGRPGARAAKRLGLQVSKSTVLRVLRAQPLPPTGLVRRT